MKARIAVIAGDGNRPEVIAGACACGTRGQKFGHDFWDGMPRLSGGAAIDLTGDPLRSRRAILSRSDAVAAGAIGGPSGSNCKVRPARPAAHPQGQTHRAFFSSLRPIGPTGTD
jgi:isocitrate/isopropylmalate dehydrogenase